MLIKRSVIDRYVKARTALRNGARESLSRALSRIDFDAPNAYALVHAAVSSVCTGSAAISAQYAAALYDVLRDAQVGGTIGAVAAYEVDEAKVARAAGASVKAGREKGLAAALDIAYSRAGYEISAASGQTMYANGVRDGRRVRFARMASGAETCQFCLMLASRGFVYTSEEAAGYQGHYHANCDCVVVPQFAKDARYEGYDPDAEYVRWQDAMRADAEGRASRNGTSVDEELEIIRRNLEKSAERARRRAKHKR